MSFLDSLTLVLATAIGTALLYAAVQLGRGLGPALVDAPDRLILRATPLTHRAAQLLLGILLPGIGLLLLGFGARHRFYLMMAVGGLLSLLFGGGAILFFWFLFDRATLIDKHRGEIRRGRKHTTAEALGSVRVEHTPTILYAWAYPRFTVSLVSHAMDTLSPGQPRRTILDPFHAVFSSLDRDKAIAAASLLAGVLGLPLQGTDRDGSEPGQDTRTGLDPHGKG
jgi:hypothetical protein